MLYVGVDHHKHYSYLTAVDAGGKVRKSCRLPNEREVLAQVLADLGEPCCSVLEAGRSWGVMYDLLEELEAQPVLANPYQVRAIAQAKVKTDRIDSHTLAQLLRGDLIPRAHVPTRATRYLKDILRQRLFLVRMRTMIKNRVHALLDRNHVITPHLSDLFGRAGRTYLAALELPAYEGALLQGHLRLLGTLDEHLKETEGWLSEALQEDRRVSLLRTVPGLGPILGALVALEIDDISRFPVSAKLCAYAGLVPSVHSSGGKTYCGRLLFQSNHHLRWAMIEAAWLALGRSPYCRAYYERIRRHKNHNVAITALARRLLEIVHAILTEDRPYQERPVPTHVAPAALAFA